MKYTLLTTLFLLNSFPFVSHAFNLSVSDVETTNAIYEGNQDVSARYHAQWDVDVETQKKLHEAYGMQRISFDQHGRPIPKGLTTTQKNRWERLYQLCMSDGCYFCDAAEGSCE